MSQRCMFCTDRVEPNGPYRNRNSSIVKSPHRIERYALDNRARIGSLYDAWTDSMPCIRCVERNFICNKDVETTEENPIIEVKSVNDGNYLGIIPITDDLWVSIALGTVSNLRGLPLLYDYKPPTDHSAQFLYYRRTDHQRHLLEDAETARNLLRNLLHDTNATHIITAIEEGMDFVIAVEFSRNEDPSRIQQILEKVKVYFTKSDASYLAS